jgi:hypothetical protein
MDETISMMRVEVSVDRRDVYAHQLGTGIRPCSQTFGDINIEP